MIIDLTSWIKKEEYESKQLRSIASDIGIDDKDNFYAFYGSWPSLSFFVKKMKEAESGSLGRVSIPIEIDDFFRSCKGIDDVGLTNLFHERYSDLTANFEILRVLTPLLSEEHVRSYEDGKRIPLGEALAHNTSEKLALIRKAYPNIKVLVMAFQNLDIDNKKNSVAIILDKSIMQLDKIAVSGFGKMERETFTAE